MARFTGVVMVFWIVLFFCAADLQQLSEAIGTVVGRDLKGMEIDYEAFVRGLKEGREGKEPSMTIEECLDSLGARLAEQNLKEANAFLAQMLHSEGVVSSECGKLLYRIKEKRDGEEVQLSDSPLVRYEGRTLGGHLFNSSEEVMSLDTVIEGLRKGIVGMREGEKRTLYIHPDLGFGAEDRFMPNALLIFDVEVIKANSSEAIISSDLAGEKERC